MATKQSKAALIRLVENAIRQVGDIPRDRFYLLVRDIKTTGSPPTHITASVLLRFLPSGAPFCCGEPDCYSRVFCESGAEELGEYIRRRMNPRHTVNVVLQCDAEYYDGIEFTAFQGRPTRHGRRPESPSE